MISALLPWSTSTLLTSNPPIRRVTTNASTWGLKVPTLSSSEKPRTSCGSALVLLGPLSYSSSSGCDEIDIILKEDLAYLFGVTRMNANSSQW